MPRTRDARTTGAAPCNSPLQPATVGITSSRNVLFEMHGQRTRLRRPSPRQAVLRTALHGQEFPSLAAAPALLLRLGDHRRGVRDHGGRRHGSNLLLAAPAAAGRRIRLGPRPGGWRLLVRLSGLGAAEP